MTDNTETINGITYLVEVYAERSDGRQCYNLTKIGRRGRPVKQSRPALRRDDGAWDLGPWVRI